jgi:hypothetical protein
MSARCWSLFPLLFVACGTVHDWRELRTDPMTLAEAYEGIAFVASGDGFLNDASVSDRGLGTWQSRWKQRTLENRHPGRFRLRAEVLLDQGSAANGWPIRYAILQQTVKDLRRSVTPQEDDWSNNGQDREREAILGEKLFRRLAPKGMAKQQPGQVVQ